MGWALSCLQLRNFYNDVELVTDKVGKQLLIDELGLPYTSVKVVLDEKLEGCPNRFWATSKLVAYGLQDSPFIHVDGDVFISKPFSQSIHESEILSQNIEDDYTCYRIALDAALDFKREIPTEILSQRSINNKPLASCMGIFGGNNIEFIKDYSSRAMDFSKEFYSDSTDENLPFFNTLFEQELMHSMADIKKIPIQYFFEIDSKKYNKFNFDDPLSKINFRGNNQYGFVHLGGYHKREYLNCLKLAFVLRTRYQKYYKRINQVLGKRNHLKLYFEPAPSGMF
jgi:hypothetical protein